VARERRHVSKERPEMSTQILIARLLVIAAFACGLIGLIAGMAGRLWKLGPTGWFTGGALLALLALVAYLEHRTASRDSQSG
jgi:hypothetical protein